MIWSYMAIIVFLGCQGGLLNASLTDGGIVKPHWVEVAAGKKLWKPGWLGNVVVGGFSAFVTWGLYGPLAGASLFSGQTQDLTLGQLAGAIITGVGGSRILTNEVDKQITEASKEEIARASRDDLRRLVKREIGILRLPPGERSERTAQYSEEG